MWKRTLLAMLLAAVWTAPACAQVEQGVGYPTVAGALAALKAKDGVKLSERGGWTIVDDRAAGAVWSFTPAGHPAHPAVVKRVIGEHGGQVAVNMTALCQAGKAACDQLIEEFRQLNEQMAQSMRGAAARAPTVAPSAIAVRRLGADAFRLELKSYRSRAVDAGQDELAPKASELCGGRRVAYGRYQFEAAEALDPAATAAKGAFVLRQEIACGDAAGAPAPLVSAANGDPQWRPTAAQVERVEAQTRAYFAAKDGRQYGDAYARLSAAQQKIAQFEPWRAAAQEFNARAGQVRQRAIKKITWYNNPPQAQPGIFAAVDFSGQFANADLYCGYLVWSEQADGTFLLDREEQNILDKTIELQLKPAELAQVRAQFRCLP